MEVNSSCYGHDRFRAQFSAILEPKTNAQKNVLAVTCIVLSCMHTCARWLQLLAQSLRASPGTLKQASNFSIEFRNIIISNVMVNNKVFSRTSPTDLWDFVFDRNKAIAHRVAIVDSLGAPRSRNPRRGSAVEQRCKIVSSLAELSKMTSPCSSDPSFAGPRTPGDGPSSASNRHLLGALKAGAQQSQDEDYPGEYLGAANHSTASPPPSDGEFAPVSSGENTNAASSHASAVCVSVRVDARHNVCTMLR